MSEWFRDAFGEDYLELYAHRNRQEAGHAADLIIRAIALDKGSHVADVPCGAGRHVQAFRERGMKAVGFDLSPVLIQEATATQQQRGYVARADIRAIPFRPAAFDLVVNLFSSLGYFDTDDDNLAVVAGLCAMVRSGGHIAIDFLHDAWLKQNLQAESSRVLASGTAVHDERSISGDPLRVNKVTTLTRPDGTTRQYRESVRLFSPDDLRAALVENGIQLRHEFGNYEGGEFFSGSSRIILIGQKA